MDHRQRVENADRTAALVAALKMLQSTDFGDMMGSGIMVKLTPITDGKHLADEFVLAAEDMEKVKPGIISSLRTSLELRKVMLRSEIASIEAVTKPA